MDKRISNKRAPIRSGTVILVRLSPMHRSPGIFCDCAYYLIDIYVANINDWYKASFRAAWVCASFSKDLMYHKLNNSCCIWCRNWKLQADTWPLSCGLAAHWFHRRLDSFAMCGTISNQLYGLTLGSLAFQLAHLYRSKLRCTSFHHCSHRPTCMGSVVCIWKEQWLTSHVHKYVQIRTAHRSPGWNKMPYGLHRRSQ